MEDNDLIILENIKKICIRITAFDTIERIINGFGKNIPKERLLKSFTFFKEQNDLKNALIITAFL